MFAQKLIVPLVSVSVLLTATSLAGAHEEIYIGHTAAGQLKVHTHFPQPVELPESRFPGVTGWADAELGFTSATLADEEPDEDFFALPDSVDMCFIFISADPGAQIYNEHGTAPMVPNEIFGLGNPYFMFHPLFNVLPEATGREFALTFIVRDRSGQLADSEPFSISFTPENPCPGDWNRSGAIDSQDFFDFVTAFFADHADINHDEVTNSQDFFDFMIAFFGQCP